MKRTDIKAGQDYLVNTSNDWAKGRYGQKRYRVISDEAWVSANGCGYRREGPAPVVIDGVTYQTTAKPVGSYDAKTNVLAIEVRLDGTLGPRAEAIATRSIRGEWAVTSAAVAVTMEKCEQQRKTAEAGDDALRARQNDLIGRLKSRGLRGSVGRYGAVEIDTANLSRLLDMLAETEATS